MRNPFLGVKWYKGGDGQEGRRGQHHKGIDTLGNVHNGHGASRDYVQRQILLNRVLSDPREERENALHPLCIVKVADFLAVLLDGCKR